METQPGRADEALFRGDRMRSFFNSRSDIVTQAIDGLVAASGGRLLRFAPESHARVVVRADWDRTKVAVVSGGGSGHEPSHAGLVGAGLLTAAVCGDIFASPTVEAVLSAIVAVTGPAGCVLVVKNYTGDRLNFGLAAERAKALGLLVEMVIVADDVAIPDARQPRGVAGTVFVHKVAGHLSEAGVSLDQVVAAARKVAETVFTIGVARDTCTVPGSPRVDRIGADEVEIGLGIHGEPGVELAKPTDARELIGLLAERLEPHVDAGRPHALLFNNLGGLSGLECAVLLGEVMATPLAASIRLVAGPAGVMTALDMPGFSLSLLPLTAELEAMLTSPVGPSAFPVLQPVVPVRTIAAPAEVAGTVYEASTDAAVRQVVETVATTCLAMEGELNALDARVGDGDTGSTFAGAARAVQGRIDELPFADRAALLSCLGETLGRAMGGSSGVLLAIMLTRSGDASRQGSGWAAALLAGLDAMQAYGGAAPGDRTMIDALRPALEALVAGEGLAVAAARARTGADATGSMLRAAAGRSAYLEARSLSGVNDPGAEAVARIFADLARGR